jgi:hypothetical protein
MEYICDIDMSDFPCKFFVFNVGVTTVRMTKFKHINTYLYPIDPCAFNFIYKDKEPKNLRFRMKHGEIVYEGDDEEPEVDEVLTEDNPRVVNWNATIL